MRNQRGLTTKLTAIVVLCAAACGSRDNCAADESPKPNVLLITSEDNGPDLGCYGDRFARTPHLDRLAAQGARFERAFVATASCSESRAALLTGLYPHQNGQIGLASHHYRMFGEVPNIASRLKARGYRTGLIGKLHVNPESAFPFDFRPDVSQINVFARRDVQRVAELAIDTETGVIHKVLDEDSNPIHGFTLTSSIPLRGHSIAQPVAWHGDASWSQMSGREVRLRLQLRSADLYALWTGKRP